jgi:hypothetical protein
MMDNDPFYTHDEFGRPLDPATIARRQVLKAWRRMSSEELLAHFVKLGIYKPDGTLADEYLGTEPSAHRPTD